MKPNKATRAAIAPKSNAKSTAKPATVPTVVKSASNAFGHKGPYQKIVLAATPAAGKNGATFGVDEIRAVLTKDQNAQCNNAQILGVLRGAGFRGEIQQVAPGQYKVAK